MQRMPRRSAKRLAGRTCGMCRSRTPNSKHCWVCTARARDSLLAALRSEPVAKSQKVYLVNRIEHFHYGTLYDLVFQCSDSQRTLSPICFGNVSPLGGQGSICATVNAPMQLSEIGCQGLAILLPCHAIDPRRRIALQREIRLPQSLHIDMVQ